MSDAGESTATINRRRDDQAITNVMAGLKAGGTLKIHRKINRMVLEGLPENHPCMGSRQAKTISISRGRKLEQQGVITQSGIDQYMISEVVNND